MSENSSEPSLSDSNNKSQLCQVKVLDFEPCLKPVYKDNKCIFHCQKTNSQEEESFKNALIDYITKPGRDGQTLDFTGFIFPAQGWVITREFKESVIFDRAVFEGELDFRGFKFTKK